MRRSGGGGIVAGVLARADSGDDGERDKESGTESQQEFGLGLGLGEGIRNSGKSFFDLVGHGFQFSTTLRKGK